MYLNNPSVLAVAHEPASLHMWTQVLNHVSLLGEWVIDYWSDCTWEAEAASFQGKVFTFLMVSNSPFEEPMANNCPSYSGEVCPSRLGWAEGQRWDTGVWYLEACLSLPTGKLATPSSLGFSLAFPSTYS